MTDEAAMKVLYLAIRERVKRWPRSPQGWKNAIQHMTIYFEGRIPD